MGLANPSSPRPWALIMPLLALAMAIMPLVTVAPVVASEKDEAQLVRGMPSLYRAVLDQSPERIEALIAAGSDVNFRTTSAAKFPGRTPLYESVLELLSIAI